MRAVIQRVSSASVTIDGSVWGQIGSGLLCFLGFEEADTKADLEWMANKIITMRIFGDKEGKMNLSVLDVKGALLLVSQFTLHASTKKGNRPSFIKAARPEQAIPLYKKFISLCRDSVSCETGEFGADMKIAMVNDGPVTITLDSRNRE